MGGEVPAPPASVSTRQHADSLTGAAYQALAHPPSRRPMIPALQSVSGERRRGGTGGAYIGRLGSLPGTFSAAPSSWALHRLPLASVPWTVVRCRRGKKAASDACIFRTQGRRPTHDCGVEATRSRVPRAVWKSTEGCAALRVRCVVWAWIVGALVEIGQRKSRSAAKCEAGAA